MEEGIWFEWYGEERGRGCNGRVSGLWEGRQVKGDVGSGSVREGRLDLDICPGASALL